MQNAQHIAYQLWRDGDFSEAGKLLFEGTPEDQRGYWAASILALALKFAPASNLSVRRLSRMAKRRCLWSTAHRHFDSIRGRVLKFDRRIENGRQLSRDDDIRYRLCFLAELVAKVLYNATDAMDPFDEDSGWYIASQLHNLLEACKDNRFSADAELLLFGQDASLSP